MKYLIIPDLHLELTWDGLNRSNDVWAFLSSIIPEAKLVDKIIWLGDIFDSPVVSHSIIANFMAVLSKFPNKNIILRGNHDGIFETKKGSPLEEIEVSSLAQVVDKPTVIDGMLFLPYMEYAKVTPIEGKFKWGFSHLDIAEAIPGMEAEISRSSKCQLPDWAYKSCEKIISGHIHKPQTVRNGQVIILGSVLKVSTTEANDQKVYGILDTVTNTLELKPIATRNIRDYKVTYDESFKPESLVVDPTDIVSVKLTVPHNLAHKFDFRALEKRLRESCYHLRYEVDVVKEKFIRHKNVNVNATDLEIFSAYVTSQGVKNPETIIEEFKKVIE